MSDFKLTEDQLNKLRDLQSRFDAFTKRYGELRFQQIMVEEEMASVSVDMRNLEIERQETVLALQEAFGTTGSVNLQTGEFIPD